MQLIAARGPRIGAAAFVLLLGGVLWTSPVMGTFPLFATYLLVGPVAVAIWCAMTWPVATLIGAYALLAPADALLLVGGGATLTRLVGFLAVLGLSLMLVRERTIRSIPTFVLVWFAALTWMVSSVLWATNQSMALQKVEQIGLAMLIFGLTALVRSTRIDLRAIVTAVIASSSAIAAYAIVVHPVETQLGPDRVVLKTATGRADPNDLAAELIPALALCVAAATTKACGKWRIPAALLALVLFGAVLATGSRGGLIAAILVVLWAAIRARQRIVAVAFSVAIVLMSVLQGDVWDRFVGDETGAGRSDIWKVGIGAFQQHWLAGSGIGTFPDVFNSMYLAVPHHFYVGWSRPAHDLLVQSFTELGIVGGALILAALWFQFRALSSIGPDDPDRWLRVAAEAATLGGFAAALFIDVLDMKQSWIIPILIAVVASIRSRARVPAIERRG